MSRDFRLIRAELGFEGERVEDFGYQVQHQPERESCATHEVEDYCAYLNKKGADTPRAKGRNRSPKRGQFELSTELNRGPDRAASDFLRKSGYSEKGDLK